WLQPLAQLGYRAKDRVLRRVGLDAEDGADLFERDAFEMAEDECGALVAAHRLQRRGDGALHLRAEDDALGGGVLRDELAQIVARVVAGLAAFARVEKIERAVDGDAVRPGGETRAAVVGVERAIRA